MMPWRSPYLRWRLETYTGKPAETVTAMDFVRLAARDWRQMVRFLRWTAEMQGYAGAGKH